MDSSEQSLFLICEQLDEQILKNPKNDYLKYLSSRPLRALPCLASSRAISWTVS